MNTIFNHSTAPDGTPLKHCSKCGETKPCAAFSKDKNRRDGLQAHCKQCIAKYRLDNIDKAHKYGARYRIDDAVRIRERSARYRSANADKLHEYRIKNANTMREYQIKNANKFRENDARWRQANLDKVRAKEHRRRAAMRALPSQWTDVDVQRMLAYWGNRCAVCSQHVEPNNAFYILAADHWIALTSPECPGTVPCNILPLCHSKICNALGCNSAKSNADPIAWLNRLYPDDPKLVAKILSRIAKYFKTVTDGAL